MTIDEKQIANFIARDFWIKNRFDIKDWLLDYKAYYSEIPDYDKFLEDFNLDIEESKISMYEAVEEVLSKFGIRTVELHHSLQVHYDHLLAEIA